MKKSILFKNFIAILFFALAYNGLHSQSTYYWTNVGGDNLWSNSLNWDRDGLGSDGSIPNQDAGDYVVFDPGYSTANCTINQNTNNGTNKLVDFTASAGYTGTITLNATFTVETTGNFVLSAGTFTGSGTSVIIGGSMTVSGGTFNQSAASLSVTGTFTCSSGTFNNATSANSTFNSTATISGGTFNKTNTGSIIFNGSFNLSSGSYYIITTTSGQTTFENNFNQTGGLFSCAIAATIRMRVSSGASSISFTSSAGTFTHSSGTFQFITNTGSVPAAGTITINNTPSFNAVTIGNTTGTCALTLAISSTISASGLLTITNGSSGIGTRSITINTGTINASGNLTVAGAANSTTGDGTGTINLSGCTSITAPTTEGITPLCNVTFSGATRTIDLAGATQILSVGTSLIARTLTISGSGDLTFNTGTISAFGDVTVTNTGTGGGGTSTLKLTGTADQTLTGSGTAGQGRLPNITIDKSAGTLNLSSIISMAGASFTHTTGTLSAGTSTLAFYGNATISGAGTTSFTNVTIASGVTLTGKSSANINVSGAWVNSGTAYTHNNGTVTFNGAAASVSGATTTAFNHLTISSGVLTGSSGTMQVAGDWTNSVGTAGFVHNSGTVEFNGSAAQTITGATTFRNLTINNSKAATPWVTFASAVNLTGVLDVQDGALATAGLLTLISDASGTAAIGNLSDGTPEATPISGNVIAERFINEGGPEYYLLASPLTNATFEDWNGEFYMTGFTGTDDPTNSFKSVITRNEVLETWPNPANTTETITNGTGYMCYIGNDGIGTNLPKTLNITGAVKTGGFTTAALPNTNNEISTLNNDGWHLLGNTYACPIIWDNVFGNVGTTNMNATAMRKLASGAYAAIPAGGTIASGEAFWVYAESASPDGTVEFQENDKSPAAADGYNTKHTGTALSFNLVLKEGTYEDSPAEIILTNKYLNIPTSVGYDPILDAAKKTNQQGKENLATLISDNTTGGYIRNYIPDTVSQLTIPIRVWKASPANINKTYSIDFNNVAALYENNKCLSFEDTYAGISFPLTTDTTYTFSMNDTTYVPRFFIHISSPVTSMVTNIGCNGGAYGSIVATGTGSGPFNYLWKNQAGDTLRNVTSSATDTLSNLGEGIYYLTVANNGSCGTVSDHFELTSAEQIVLSGIKTDIACYGDSSGSAQVLVSGGNSPFSYAWSNGENQAQISNLKSQVYFVTVTDAAGCSNVDSVTITQPGELFANPTAMNLACFGDSNGSATVLAAGGSAPYTYSWNNGENTSSISGLSAAVYYFTVTDNSGCTKSDSVSITQPDALVINPTLTNVLCNGGNSGQASINVSGGTSDYTYLWSNGEITAQISNLLSQNYTVTVTDANNCSASQTVNISQPPAITITSSLADALCYGSNDGMAAVSPSGGTPGYTFLWSTGGIDSSETALPAGNYTVTVSDALGCAGIASILIVEPSEIIITGTTVASTCGNANGGASIMVIGGTGSYAYEWVTGDSVPDINNVAAGNYTVTVTDQNNCSVVSSITISDVGGPSVNVNSASDASCNGGSNGQVTASASGGTAPYAYLWSNGSVDANISSLAAGTYILTVTDANNCAGIISVEISEPAAIAISSMVTNALCGNTDGTASVSVTGGTPPYTYSWSNGESVPAISNLAPGNYYVLVSDANGCSKMATVTINNISGPALSSPTLTQPTCYGFSDGAISYSANGNGPFNYTWQNATGDTLKYSSGIVSSDLLTNLPAGDYSLIVSDNNGCISATTIVITQPAEVSATFTLNDDTVDIAAGGTISITNSSFGAVQYTWSFGDGYNSTQFEPDHSYNTTGVYTVMLTAAQGQCADTTQQVVVVINSVGIPEGIKENAIKIVQHGEKVIVQYNFSVNTAMTIELYNIIGQNILQGFKQEVVAGNIEISLPEATGIYFLKVKTERGEHIHKIFR